MILKLHLLLSFVSIFLKAYAFSNQYLIIMEIVVIFVLRPTFFFLQILNDSQDFCFWPASMGSLSFFLMPTANFF